jgi:hypothetical protein
MAGSADPVAAHFVSDELRGSTDDRGTELQAVAPGREGAPSMQEIWCAGDSTAGKTNVAQAGDESGLLGCGIPVNLALLSDDDFDADEAFELDKLLAWHAQTRLQGRHPGPRQLSQFGRMDASGGSCN